MNWKKYGPWWGRFTSALVATVCGIALTIGIGQHNNIKAKKDYVRKSEIIAMNSIERMINQAQGYLDNYTQRIEAISKVDDMYPDSLRYCSKAHIEDFCSAFYYVQYTGFDDSAETLFNSSADVWVNAQSLQAISSINQLFKVIDILQAEIKDIESIFQQICERCLPEALIDNDDPMKAAMTFLNDKNTVFAIKYDLPSRVTLLERSIKMARTMYRHVMQRLDITEEEIRSCDADIPDISM